jgi:DNA-binding beta-propeller fold protein YncE
MSAAVLVLLAAAPAAFGGKKPNGNVRVDLVWPLPPDQPRIRLIQVLHGAADVEPKKKAGFLDRLAGIEKKQFKPSFVKPYGIATDSEGRVYVTDSGQGIVFVFDQEKKKVTYLGRDPQLRLHVPIGITVDAKNRVWVADAIGQHVVAYAPEGNILTVLGKSEEMLNPTAVAVDDVRNRAYVVDSKRHAVLVYNPDTGELLHTLGKRGSGKGEFNFPTNITLDSNGRLYVTDTMNCRVEIFDPDYNFVDTFGAQGRRRGDFLKPKGVAVDPWGNIYVTDSDFDNFQIFDSQKRLLMFLGTAGQAPGTFWLPAGIHIDRRNRIYVADQNNRRIQIFQLLDGAPVPAPLKQRAAEAAKGGDPEPK